MVEAFSLLAVGTSLIGTLLGFSEFFKEQLNNLSWNSPLTQTLQVALMLMQLSFPSTHESQLHNLLLAISFHAVNQIVFMSILFPTLGRLPVFV